jgi:hypothetical protein
MNFNERSAFLRRKPRAVRGFEAGTCVILDFQERHLVVQPQLSYRLARITIEIKPLLPFRIYLYLERTTWKRNE